MKILLYSTDDGLAAELKNMISCRLNNFDIILCKSFDSLCSSPSTTFMYFAVVLMVASKEELQELLSVQRMFDNTKVLLVLPDNSVDLMRDALKLYPRYVTERGESLAAIPDVLTMMYSSLNKSFKAIQVDTVNLKDSR